MSFIEKLLEAFTPRKSSRWVMWKTELDLKTCAPCRNLHGRIFPAESAGGLAKWPQHLYCRCKLDRMDVLPAGIATQDGIDGADYSLVHSRKLPNHYLTKEEAIKLGWEQKEGNLSEVAPGKSLGDNIYENRKGLLPQANGRIWYEADVNYTTGYRGTDRVFYSNDGLIFVSYDHGVTFFEISGKGRE